MLFGYLIARALLVLAHLFGRLPARYIKAFARLLDAVSGPFHVVNYYGSCCHAAFGLPRVFRTGNPRLIHAAACRFRYSSWTSCGVRYPSAE